MKVYLGSVWISAELAATQASDLLELPRWKVV